MTYTMRLTETATGQSVVREYDGAYSEYHWTDGNMGCDCNREMEWRRAHGVPEEDVWDMPHPCSDGRYKAEFVSGDVKEDEW